MEKIENGGKNPGGGLRRGDEIIYFGTLTLYLTLVMFIKVSHMKYDV